MKELGDRSCRRARPRTTPSIAPTLARAPEPAILTTREKSKATRTCGGSLQTATTSGSTTRGAQTMERPHCCPAARALPPSARAVCRLIAATAPSSFPARLKGGTSTCGSTPSDSRNVRTCGKGESSEREGSGAGVASVQVCCSFTRQHFLCLATRPHRLVLSHAVSSLAILRDSGDGGDSQQIIQTIPPSTSATLIMILTMHRSEDLMRDVHGERHDVAGAPPRGPCTRKQTSSKVDFLNPPYEKGTYMYLPLRDPGVTT